MKTLEVSDAAYAALQEVANGLDCTPDELLNALFHSPGARAETGEPLAAFLVGPDFRAQPTESEKYLALLGWIAERHRAELTEFIEAQTGASRFLRLSPADVLEACRQHQSRPIKGTPYWAIMNIDQATKRRFLLRLLDFVGYRQAVGEFACGALGLGGPRGTRVLALAG